AVLNAVVPPLVLTLTRVPAVPLVWSHARKVADAEVAFCPSGTSRSLSVERNSSADVLLTVPTSLQVLPAFAEYCQVPVPLLRLLTAMPFIAPLSTSVTFPEISAETRSPLPFV